MSYDAELAAMRLTGTAADLSILEERERRYLIGVNGQTDRLIIPTKHYWELRNMYKMLIHERDGEPEPLGDMSIEQAIAILNPSTQKKILAAYEYYGGFQGNDAMAAACVSACRIAVKIMRERLIEAGVEQ